MISVMAEPQTPGGSEGLNRRPLRLRLGLWVVIALVFAAQVGLIYWLGNPPPAASFQAPAAPVIHLGASGSQELLALQDPTLFVLPHRDNFSGAGWLKITNQEFAPTNWSEPARPLELPLEQLGAAFATFMQTNLPPQFQPQMDSGLDTADENPAPLVSISVASTLRVEGDLARLRQLTPLHLPPQTNSDLLTNTVVQLLVDARGNPFSAVILASSGDPRADAEALTNFAKAVRFEPAETAALGAVPRNKMIEGKLIFEWQTLPPLPTNTPPSTP